tara:strand:- start:28 stop:573 length:546 start_codon:yes stop_codon:yes gene_type:complete
MSNAKVVSTKANKVADYNDPFWIESNKIIINIVDGEVKVNKGYTALAVILMDMFNSAEVKAGLVFEKISRASSGGFADAVNMARDHYEAMFTKAGHLQPRGAWLKIQKSADTIRNGATQKPADGKRNINPADEYSVDKLIGVYNKAIKTAGEIDAVDTARPHVLKALNALGVKSTDKRLKS